MRRHWLGLVILALLAGYLLWHTRTTAKGWHFGRLPTLRV